MWTIFSSKNVDYTSENSSEIFQEVSDIIYLQKDIENWRLKIPKKDDFGHILRPYRKVTCKVRTILITVIDTTEPPLSVGIRL